MLNQSNKAEWFDGWRIGCLVLDSGRGSRWMLDAETFAHASLVKMMNPRTARAQGYVAALASAVGVL